MACEIACRPAIEVNEIDFDKFNYIGAIPVRYL